MTDALDITVTKVERSKLNDLDLENIPFGKYFTDHMLEADYENGEWTNVEIKPYQPLVIEPSLVALHYGQSIFEGIKAYKNEQGEAFIFRPHDNYRRMNISAERINMPAIPEDIFMDGMRQLVELDKNWIPNKDNYSLYIRPLMFATDTALGVRPSETYKFIIILSPTGPYFTAPMKIAVEEKYTRAAPGGVGFAKNAGNYGGSMMPATIAKKLGYDQVLWTDAFEHKWLQEVGMMNVAFVINGTVITPSMEEGTILNGVTRDSILTLCGDLHIPSEVRKISIDEVMDAYNNGTLQEIFGMGTAATIAMISTLKYRDLEMKLDAGKYTLALQLKNLLNEIKTCKKPDNYGWLYKV